MQYPMRVIKQDFVRAKENEEFPNNLSKIRQLMIYVNTR